jgi:hypothetical protein
MDVAQIRITGDEETVKAIVDALNDGELDTLAFALQAPRKGRKGNAYLAYGTIKLDQSEYQPPACAYHPDRTAVGIRQGMMLCEECTALDNLPDWEPHPTYEEKVEYMNMREDLGL